VDRGGRAARVAGAAAFSACWLGVLRGVVALAALLAMPALAATYHVRPDGGSLRQCSGLVDAPYGSAVKDRACAWSHPMIALPSDGLGGGESRIAAGDTLEIAPGQYAMGFGAPGAERCYLSAPWDCMMASPPSGLSADRPTRIVGKNAATCPVKPQLWGQERLFVVLTLKKVEHVAVECLEITDHAECVAIPTHPMACRDKDFPYGPWASIGLWIEDAKDLRLRHLHVHGLANSGVVAGRVENLSVADVLVAGNPMAGWDGELHGARENSDYRGRQLFERFVVEWNGCIEGYPERRPKGCFAQTAGGYGDGMGLARTGGDFVFRDSTFRFNTSDGLDLLYHTKGGTIVLDRVRAEGNAGNPVKLAGASTVTNSVILGNCDFFKGKPFTHHVDHCRARGDALVVTNVLPGDRSAIVNNTIVSAGNVTILVGGPGSSSFTLRNNVVVALPFALYPRETSADIYCARDDGSECSPWPRIDRQHDTVINTRNRRSWCSADGMRCEQRVAPPFGLARADTEVVDPRLPAGSPHRDAGVPWPPLPALDLLGRPRVAGRSVDRGAVEAPVAGP